MDGRSLGPTKDLLDYIVKLERRIANLERSRRAGHTSIESEQLTVRAGDIVLLNSDGTIALYLRHGDNPGIEYYPQGSSGAFAKTLAQENLYEVGIKANAGNQNGGKLLLTNNSTWLSNQRADGEGYIQIGDGSDPEKFTFRGKWTGATIDTQAVVVGSRSVDAGFSSLAVSYGVSLKPTVIPIVSVYAPGGTVVASCLTNVYDGGFTVAWTDTTAKIVNFWSFRI